MQEIHDTAGLSIQRQCELLALSRASVYYERKKAVSKEDLLLMRFFDALHSRYPFMGSRRLRDKMTKPEHRINRKRAQRLMRVMDLETPYPKQRASDPNKAHRRFPTAERPRHRTVEPGVGNGRDVRSHGAWFFLPRRHRGLGEPCGALVVAVEHARPGVCVEALKEAIARLGRPAFNTHVRGISNRRNRIRISMDGKERWADNVFAERLWRSVKYEEIYLKTYNTVTKTREGLTNYFRFYNHECRYQTLEQTPWNAYTTTMAEAA